jgi:hypothetical protein
MSKVMSKTYSKFVIPFIMFLAMQAQYWKVAFVKNGQLGGYVHDTNMAQYIPPTSHHVVTGTWSLTAGSVAGMISHHKAAAAETTTVNVPICISSNAIANKGAYLKKIVINYEVGTADMTSITPTVNLVTTTADAGTPTVAAQTFTQTPVAATAKAQGKRQLIITITTPFWVADTQYVLVALSCVCAAGTVLDFTGDVAYFTERM